LLYLLGKTRWAKNDIKNGMSTATVEGGIMDQQESTNQEEMRFEAEPWEEWEGKLVKYSLLIGVGALAVLGALANIFILH